MLPSKTAAFLLLAPLALAAAPLLAQTDVNGNTAGGAPQAPVTAEDVPAAIEIFEADRSQNYDAFPAIAEKYGFDMTRLFTIQSKFSMCLQMLIGGTTVEQAREQLGEYAPTEEELEVARANEAALRKAIGLDQ
jgi:hypothetical protein